MSDKKEFWKQKSEKIDVRWNYIPYQYTLYRENGSWKVGKIIQKEWEKIETWRQLVWVKLLDEFIVSGIAVVTA